MQVARPRVVAAAGGEGEQEAPGERRAACVLAHAAYPVRQVLGERGERAQPGGAVVGVVEQRPDERRPDDHPVGVRRHLGGLVAVADAEAHAHRQLGARALVRATSGPASSLVVARAPVTPMTAVA